MKVAYQKNSVYKSGNTSEDTGHTSMSTYQKQNTAVHILCFVTVKEKTIVEAYD